MATISPERRKAISAIRRTGFKLRTKTGTVEKPVQPKTSHELLKIYRIEHPESGKGPFTHNAGVGRFASDAMVYMTEPHEMCEGLRCGCPHYYAFETMGHLMASIERFVLLREYGFHIAVYESNEHIVLPDGQVAFIMEKANKLSSHEIHEFPFEEYF